MISNRKICMLGDFGVGKTSLVHRFVDQAFSEKYQTTVGVKIDTKVCQTEHNPIKLVIWDIAGSAELGRLQKSYTQGMAGYLLVCDGTRMPTLTSVKSIHATLATAHPNLPFCVLVNKSDLEDLTEVQEMHIAEMREGGWIVIRTSAKSGDQVEEAFQFLADQFNNADLNPI